MVYICSSAAFPASSLRGKRTLELGAGVSGLPSLVAASLGSFSEASTAHPLPGDQPETLCLFGTQLGKVPSSSNGVQVWVTDIDECMEGLTQNITDNLPTGVRLCTQPPARQQVCQGRPEISAPTCGQVLKLCGLLYGASLPQRDATIATGSAMVCGRILLAQLRPSISMHTPVYQPQEEDHRLTAMGHLTSHGPRPQLQ